MQYNNEKNNTLVSYEIISEGAFSQIIKNHENSKYVVKKINNQEEAIECYYNEITILGRLNEHKHKNIIAMESSYECRGEFFIKLEFADAGDLKSFIAKNKMLEEFYYDTCLQISEALVFLKSMNIVHADIKPQNILLKSDGKKFSVKLADFGLSMILYGSQKFINKSCVGTLAYVAPESLAVREYSNASDIYSFGIVILAMQKIKLPCIKKSNEQEMLIAKMRYDEVHQDIEIAKHNLYEYIRNNENIKNKEEFYEEVLNFFDKIKNSLELLIKDLDNEIKSCLEVNDAARQTAENLKIYFSSKLGLFSQDTSIKNTIENQVFSNQKNSF